MVSGTPSSSSSPLDASSVSSTPTRLETGAARKGRPLPSGDVKNRANSLSTSTLGTENANPQARVRSGTVNDVPKGRGIQQPSTKTPGYTENLIRRAMSSTKKSLEQHHQLTKQIQGQSTSEQTEAQQKQAAAHNKFVNRFYGWTDGERKAIKELHKATLSADPGKLERAIQGAKPMTGSVIDYADENGKTAFHHACLKGDATTLQQLIDANDGFFDYTAQDETGSNALHYAVASGNMEAVALILEIHTVGFKDHDLLAVNHQGQTILDIAGQKETVEALKSVFESAGVPFPER